jgi:3-dehydroquinate dehydratase-2
MKISIINGPNLNLLNQRDSKIYGNNTLEEVKKKCLEIAVGKAEINFFQSNSESEIIDQIHQNIKKKFDSIIINPAAYTHSSIAIRDALEIFKGKKIELHISNIFKREEFRHESKISAVVDGVISGLGVNGYLLAIQSIINHSKKTS